MLKRTEAPNVWGGFCSLCRPKCEFLTGYLLSCLLLPVLHVYCFSWMTKKVFKSHQQLMHHKQRHYFFFLKENAISDFGFSEQKRNLRCCRVQHLSLARMFTHACARFPRGSSSSQQPLNVTPELKRWTQLFCSEEANIAPWSFRSWRRLIWWDHACVCVCVSWCCTCAHECDALTSCSSSPC